MTVQRARLSGVAVVCIASLFLWAIGGCRSESGWLGQDADGGDDAPALFQEIQDEMGLDFVHDPGTPGTWYYPEIMIMGAAFLDYDRDGDLDIYLLNCGEPIMSGVQRDPTRAKNRLYRQEASGKFVDVTDASGLGDEGYSIGVAVGDINNDGFPDVYVTNFGPDRLFLNDRNGHFQDITESAGITNERWSAAACFLDYDRDGWLDLYVANYVDYFPARKCYGASGRRDYCGPASFDKTVDRLYRNTTGEQLASAAAIAVNTPSVRYQDVSLSSGIAKREGSGLGVVSMDFNDDGWQDIYVANDMMANFLWVNQGDGTFRDEAILRGVAYDALGRPQASMGIAASDLNQDLIPDIYVTHMAGEMNVLYLSEGTLGYVEMAMQYGLCGSLHPSTTFGCVFFDIDHDGDEDAMVSQGSMKLPDTAVDIPSYSDKEAYWNIFAEPNQIFLNDGQGAFTVHRSRHDLFTSRNEVSRGLCMGDIDNDGDLDLLLANTAAKARLYRNVAPKRGSWLRVQAIEPELGGRDAYGARIIVTAAGRKWARWVNPGGSYLSSHEPTTHFGLGSLDVIDTIEVRWPDGSTELFAGGATNQLRVLAHGGGETMTATSPAAK